MERLRELIEVIIKEHTALAFLSFIPLALLRFRKNNTEPDILGDNMPFTIIDSLNQRNKIQ